MSSGSPSRPRPDRLYLVLARPSGAAPHPDITVLGTVRAPDRRAAAEPALRLATERLAERSVTSGARRGPRIRST